MGAATPASSWRRCWRCRYAASAEDQCQAAVRDSARRSRASAVHLGLYALGPAGAAVLGAGVDRILVYYPCVLLAMVWVHCAALVVLFLRCSFFSRHYVPRHLCRCDTGAAGERVLSASNSNICHMVHRMLFGLDMCHCSCAQQSSSSVQLIPSAHNCSAAPFRRKF